MATGHGTNRFHQYNCRDVRSQAGLHFTIKSALEIEKVQMWVWKLMDPYHKTTTKTTVISEPIESKSDKHLLREKETSTTVVNVTSFL